MSYRSKPYWWLVCDHPGCKVWSTYGSDYSAWESETAAEIEAEASEWLLMGERHYCDVHAYLYDHELRQDMEPVRRFAYLKEWAQRRLAAA